MTVDAICLVSVLTDGWKNDLANAFALDLLCELNIEGPRVVQYMKHGESDGKIQNLGFHELADSQ
jgi:hypothetical protein